jgi:hypothetical protein
MRQAISFLTVIATFFASCTAPSVVTIYKNGDNYTNNIHAVLVAAVIADEDTVTRNSLENYFVSELDKAGYNAISSITAFGPKGLAGLGQEETMIKLCNHGFDAVLTIALIDGSKETYKNPPATSTYAAGYYLNRIWNYEKIQAVLSDSKVKSPHFWECVLFDLYSLRPLCAMQTQLYDVDKAGTINPDLAKRVIEKMKKEKILIKRNGNKRLFADRPIEKQ